MKIKSHPRTIIEIYVDGRVSVFFEGEPKTLRETYAINMIKYFVNERGSILAKNLEIGRYEMTMLSFKLRTRDVQFDLNPV